MKAHKFKHNENAPSHYGVVVYCEYCGVIAFWGNGSEKTNLEGQGMAVQPCPRSPESDEVKK